MLGSYGLDFRANFSQGCCIKLLLKFTPISQSFDALPSYDVARYWRGVRVIADSSLVSVQTDRPLYRPGDTVRFRILHLRPELLPVHAPIRRVWLEMSGAAGARVAEWRNVQTQLGLAQIEYALDEHAAKGEWTIHVESDEAMQPAVQSFAVADYSLPTFYLTVEHPARILKTSSHIIWTVCARHMWGEGVRGAITTLVHTDGSSSQVRLTDRLYGQPCHNQTLELARIGVGVDRDGPGVIVADVAFQEESTRLWKNTSAITRIVEESINIEFINKNKIIVSPGLPYKIKMRVTDWADEPMSSTAVKVCRSASNSTELNEPDENFVNGSRVLTEPCDIVYTDPKGYVQAAFDVPNDLTAKYYRFQASVRGAQANLTLLLRGGDQIHAALGAIGSGGLRNHVPLYISYPPQAEVMAPTVHFILVTRGGVIYRWGATTQCPQPPSVPLSNRQMSNPSTRCQNPSSSRLLLRVALPARISHQMCPHSHLLVYFYQAGQLVFAVKHFKVSECFYNKVMANWSPATVAPGKTTSLLIKSLGPALCATSVSDVALRHLLPSSDAALTLQNQLLNKLNVFMEMRRNVSLKDVPQRSCFGENGISDAAAEDYEYLISTFGASGMRILSDLLPELDCSSDQPEPLEQPSAPVPYERSYFPEAWLWDLRLLSANGSLRINVRAPDAVTEYETFVTCVSRSGVSVAPVAVLKVFQPFFVELEAPKKLKRGEQTQMFYKIFNYIDTSIAVTVDLETDADSGLQLRGAKGSSPASHTICVGVGDVYSVRLGLQGAKVGHWRLAVSANVLPQMQQYCGAEVAQTFPSDKIVKTIIVEPEGEPTEIHHSAMLCTEGDGTFDSELDWSWEISDRTVPGTERWSIWVIGDMAGPLDVKAEKLLTLPLGCGEQNMALLAFNLVALRHMELRDQIKPELKEKALANIMSGYSRQITYGHPKGGFSAFGPADEQPSSWLTAFCMRYLHSARERLSMEGSGHVLSTAGDWLVSLQMENGCFQNVGQVFHREFKGGLDSESSNIALTAYILVSLIESASVMRPDVVQSASYCLQALYRSPNTFRNVFTLSLVAYAQTRLARYENDIRQLNDVNLRDPKENGHSTSPTESVESRNDDGINAGRAISALRDNAKRSGDLVWWEAESLSTSIESTAYAILALLEMHNSRRRDTVEEIIRDRIELEDAGSAVRWISLHRNSAGGFLSTQDTLVALEALAMWSTTTAHSPPQLLVSVSGAGLAQSVQITPSNRHELSVFEAGAGDVRVRAQGQGCVLVQGTQHYNSLSTPSAASTFTLHVTLQTDGAFDCQYSATWCRCAAILQVCVSWLGRHFPEMAILDVALPTGYVTDKTLLYKLLRTDNTLLRRLEEPSESSRVVMYLATRGSYRGGRPRECYKLYLIGPQSSTMPATVQVYDYYHREVNASKSYVVPESCPGPVSHEESARLGSNKYRNVGEDSRSINSDSFEQSSAEVYPYMLATSLESNEEVAPPSYKQVETLESHESVRGEDKTKAVFDQQINSADAHSPNILEDVVANRNYKIPTSELNKIINQATTVNYVPLDIEVNVKNKSVKNNEQPKDAQNWENETNIQTEKMYTISKDLSNLDGTLAEKTNNVTSENPNKQELLDKSSAKPFSDFHIIDSDTDLDVPEGIEGPVPIIVAPPPNFAWQGPPHSTTASLAVKDHPARHPDCNDRFANWTVVTHDLAASDARIPRTLPCSP